MPLNSISLLYLLVWSTYSRNPLGQKRGAAAQGMGMTDGEGAGDAPPGIAGAAEGGVPVGPV